MKLFIENGANVNAVNMKKDTALILAVSESNYLKFLQKSEDEKEE